MSSRNIRHLVLSGGGIMGFRFLGALMEHVRRGNVDLSRIRSIYGTSAGAMLAVVLTLFAKRSEEIEPLVASISLSQHVQKWSLSTLLELYSKKGLFSADLVEHILAPFFSACGISSRTSLVELYLYSNVDVHLFTFEINTFQTVELSHRTHPNLSVVTAVAMSCALPCVFSPVFWNDGCYIDGGMFANFPVFACLRDHPRSLQRILGVVCDTEWKLQNRTISAEDNLIEYWTSFAINALNHMQNGNALRFTGAPIPHLITCKTNGNELSLTKIMEVVQSPEVRRQWMDMGAREDADTWVLNRVSELDDNGEHVKKSNKKKSKSDKSTLPYRPAIFTSPASSVLTA